MSTTTELYYIDGIEFTANYVLAYATINNSTVVSGTTTIASSFPNSPISTTPGIVELVPQDGIYFLADAHGYIYEEHAGQALSFSSAVASDPNGSQTLTNAGYSFQVSPDINSIGVDTSDDTIYFINGTTLYSESFTANFGSPTGITALDNVESLNSVTGLDLYTGGSTSFGEFASGELVYDQADHTAYFAGAAGSQSISFTEPTVGSIYGNYLYKVSGLTSGATHGTITGALGTTNGTINMVPLVDGIVAGMALDTLTDTLYFTTVKDPNLTNSSGGTLQSHAGIYAVALSGPDEGELTTIYSAPVFFNDTLSPFDALGSIAIDAQTGEYYVMANTFTTGVYDGNPEFFANGEILVGNVNNLGVAPTVLEKLPGAVGNPDTIYPVALALDSGPVLSGTSIAGIDGNSGKTAGLIGVGDTVTLALTLNGKVTVSGTPSLSLNDGGTAKYLSGSGTDVLLFTYKPSAGQDTPTLAATGLSGTITDAFGADMNGSLSATFAALGVDTTPPGLLVSGTSADALQGGSSITVLAAAPVITDPDGSGTLTGATIALTNAQSGDTLGIGGASSGTLDSGAISYDFSGSALTLSGTASLAEYESALGAVTYQDGGTDTVTAGHPVRVLDWTVEEGTLASAVQTSNVTIARPLTLSAGGTVTVMAGGSVALDSAIGLTDLDNAPVTSATVAVTSGFASGDQLDFVNQNNITGSYDSATGVLSLAGSATAADYRAALASIDFFSTQADPSFNGTDTLRGISYVVGDAAGESNTQGSEVVAVCYLHGTSILTATGPVKVEELAIGDRVATRNGGLQSIKWLGRQTFAGRFLRSNREKIPVCIRAGALGGGLPLRDLSVSPGHSLLLGDTLVLARNLVNGVTIRQEPVAQAQPVEYVQIELDTHDCVLAEGSWAETYADSSGLRAQFHNAAEFWALYPDYVTPSLPVLCLPRPQSGPRLAAALAPVVARAAAGLTPGRLTGWVDRIDESGRIDGWAQDEAYPELPVLLEILCGDEMLGSILACDERGDLREAGIGQGRCSFSFTAGRALAPGEATRIFVRRAEDGAVLHLTPAVREQAVA